MKEIVKVKYADFEKILRTHDTMYSVGLSSSDGASGVLKAELEKTLKPGKQAQMAILGVDVYRYSRQTDQLKQSLIPLVLRLLFRTTWAKCRIESPFLFQEYVKTPFERQFIDTGDGGYLLLDSPVHALVFAVTFEIMLRLFNSLQMYPGLRTVLGDEVTLRYAITYGGVFSFGTNFYGPSIITNARMLAKDRLNRFLIDDPTCRWFTRSIRGIENIPCIGMDDLQELPEFSEYDRSIIEKDQGYFFPREGGAGTTSHWKDIDILKLADVTAKNQTMCAYGLHIHFLAEMAPPEGARSGKGVPVTITLGNLNTSGIE